MKPIGQNIVIKTVDEEIRTSSGLLLSADDANQMRYKRGTVIAPGTEVVSISKDDVIYYDKRAGYTLLIKSESYTIISLSDVVVVL